MDLKTIKSYDRSWWMKHLELTTVFDTSLIKEQFDWLIQQAEKVEQLEKRLELVREQRDIIKELHKTNHVKERI